MAQFPVGRVDLAVEVTTVGIAELQTEMEKGGVGRDMEVGEDRAAVTEVAMVHVLTAKDVEGQGVGMAPGIHHEDESTAKKESKAAADPEIEVASML